MIVIAGRLSLLGFVYKPVSWLAGDSRLRQTFSLRIHLVERQSLSSICPSTIISYPRSLEASLSTSASRSTAGPIVFSLDRNKPVTPPEFPYYSQDARGGHHADPQLWLACLPAGEHSFALIIHRTEAAELKPDTFDRNLSLMSPASTWLPIQFKLFKTFP